MPTPTKGPRIGGSPAHQRIILANLASQLFEHGRITTTETRARRVQPLAERLISKAKRADLHNRRMVLSTITDKNVVHTLFADIAPQMQGREGGYTRITKVGNRKGDNAPMAVIELVLEAVTPKKAAKKTSKKTAEPKTEAPKVEEPAVDETEVVEPEVVEAEVVEAEVVEAEVVEPEVVEPAEAAEKAEKA